MTLEEISRWRNWAGKLGAVFGVLFLIGAIDGLSARVQERENVLNMLAGETRRVNGPASDDIKETTQLDYMSDSDAIRLSFKAVHTGFWLGGRMWRGELMVDDGTDPGEYVLGVGPKGAVRQKTFAVFQIRLHEDVQSLRQSSKSLIKRHLHISPWWVLAVFMPLAGLTFALVFYLSHRREELLVGQGKAEIYWVARRDTHWEFAFGLGTQHGIQPGARLAVIHEDGRSVGQFTVHEAFRTYSTGVVDLDWPIKPGYLVSTEAGEGVME